MSTLFSLPLVRTLTTRLLFLGPEPGVVGLACTVLGPNAWLLPAYVLTGIFASGSGAHESTGRWSDGSMTLPSKPTMGSCGLRSTLVVSLDLAFLFGDSGMWYGLWGLGCASSCEARAEGLYASKQSGEKGMLKREASDPGGVGRDTSFLMGVICSLDLGSGLTSPWLDAGLDANDAMGCCIDAIECRCRGLGIARGLTSGRFCGKW